MPSVPATIVRGSDAHHAACLAVARALSAFFDERGLAQMARDLEAHELLVALAAAEVLGFLTLARKGVSVAEISWMGVRPSHQGHGIGAQLVERAASDLRAEGVALLEVKTLSERVDYAPYEATRRFYRRQGFVEVEVVDPYPAWGHGNPCAIYVRSLAATK